jgi:hypothetical protein
MTILNRGPLPLISNKFDQVKGAKVFSTLDLYRVYHLLHNNKDDEWKTAFRTRYGHVEWTVMPFGLANAPATFQAFINDIFGDLLDLGVLFYLDNILVYATNQQEHDALLFKVLKRLQDKELYCTLSKCIFSVNLVNWLGHIVSKDRIEMDPTKEDSIKSWPVLRNVKDLQQFLGFLNYYHTFIPSFGI